MTHSSQLTAWCKIFFLLFEIPFISAKQNGLPMHSQLALTEYESLNLAPLILLDPVQSRGLAICSNREQEQNARSIFLGTCFLTRPAATLLPKNSCRRPSSAYKPDRATAQAVKLP